MEKLFDDEFLLIASRSNLVECFGLPGSGKSFYSDILNNKLQKEGIKTISNSIYFTKYSKSLRFFIKSRMVLYALATKPLVSAKLLIWIMQQKVDSKLQLARLIYNGLSVLAAYPKDNKHLIIIDQGVIQLFWAIAMNTKSQNDGFKNPLLGISVMKSLFKNKRIIFLNITPEIDAHIDQVKERKDINFDEWKQSLEKQKAAKIIIMNLVNTFCKDNNNVDQMIVSRKN